MYLFHTIKKIISEGDFLSIIKEVLFKIYNVEWKKELRLFNKLYTNKKWQSALKLGESILETEIKNADFLQKIAVCYMKKDNYDKAENYIKRSLELKTNNNIDYIISTVDISAFSETLNVKSRFVYLGGATNLGFVEHEYIKEDEKYQYLTKIVRHDYPTDHFADKESFFNLVICREYPKLEDMTPEMINYLELKKEKLVLMTFEKLSDDQMDYKNLKDVIKLSQNLSNSIEYKDVVKILKETDRGKSSSLSSLMHSSSAHKYILKNLKNKVSNLEHSLDLDSFLERVRHIIIELKMYEKIIPEKHYVFCHRDFDENNILYNKKDNRYYIIDWSTYGLGIIGHDLTKFFWTAGLIFSEIKEVYLDNIENETEDITVNKIFFTYNLLRLWIGRLDKSNIEKQIDECISPAIEYMEDLSERSELYGIK